MRESDGFARGIFASGRRGPHTRIKPETLTEMRCVSCPALEIHSGSLVLTHDTASSGGIIPYR